MSATLPRGRYRLAGKTVLVASGHFAGQLFRIEDWAENVLGRTWSAAADDNLAALEYATRVAATMAEFERGTAKRRLPTDDNVLYGKIGMLGHIIHVSEIVAHG